MAKERSQTAVVQPYSKTNSNPRQEQQQQQGRCSQQNKTKKNNDGNINTPPQRNGGIQKQDHLHLHQKHRTLANNSNQHHNKKLAAARSASAPLVAHDPEPHLTGRTRLPLTTCSSHNTTTTTTTTINKQQQRAEVSEEMELSPGGSSRSRSSSKSRRRFQLRSSTLKRLLSSTFKDLSLGYYISIVMVISFKIFIFANTLNTVMGAKTFYMHWNTSNSIFRIDNTDHIIDVNKGNLAFEYDQVHIICPVYEPGTFDNETEKLIIYNVSKAEYETCRITNANPRIIAVCDKPHRLMYFTITFRPFTPSPGGLEFLPGNDYYFISTSSKDDLHRRIGGRCSTNNMKVVFKVCCGGGGGGGSAGGDTLTIGESNRTSPARGGNTKKALAVTTPLPSVKIWSVPSSPAVVSHRPTINQPVVLQNDFVMTPVQNHSYGGGGGGSSSGNAGGGRDNWQSSTAATKKTLKPSDFDKRANEVVKYDQELNVNEKSTTNEMVGGGAARQQQRQHLGVLGILVAGTAAVRLRWLY